MLSRTIKFILLSTAGHLLVWLLLLEITTTLSTSQNAISFRLTESNGKIHLSTKRIGPPAKNTKVRPIPSKASKSPSPKLPASVKKSKVTNGELNHRKEKDRSASVSPIAIDASKLAGLQLQYPKRSLRLGEEGSVSIKITEDTGGEIVLTTLHSSGFPRLDKAASLSLERYFLAKNDIKTPFIVQFNFRIR